MLEERLPPVAVTVNVPDHLAPVLVAVSVSLLVPFPGRAITAGEKLAVTPVGRPPMVRVTADPKPPEAIVVIVIVVEAPALRLTAPVLALALRTAGA